MATLHDLIVWHFNTDAKITLEWLPSLPPDFDREAAPTIKDEFEHRKLLRLLANGAVAALALGQHTCEYHSELRHIRPIVRRRDANRVSSKLLEISEWAEAEQSLTGDPYRFAARLCEMLMEHYAGVELSETFDDAADYYQSAVGYASYGPEQDGVLELLNKIQKIES